MERTKEGPSSKCAKISYTWKKLKIKVRKHTKWLLKSSPLMTPLEQWSKGPQAFAPMTQYFRSIFRCLRRPSAHKARKGEQS